jgi:hypothetical protein
MPLPAVTDRKLGPQGEVLQITEALVDPATVPSGGLAVQSDAVRATGTGVAVRTTSQLASGETYPLLTGRGLEPQTRMPWSVTEQIVAAGMALPAPSALVIESTIKAVDKWRSIQTATTLDAMPASYVEYRNLHFRFPGLFYGYEAMAGGIVSERRTFSHSVVARVTVSFSDTGAAPVLQAIVPVAWSYPLGFTASDVLTNGEHFDYTDGTTSLSLDVPASTPSRTDYEALIGSYIAVQGTCTRWKGGIWRTELWEIVAQ